MLKKYKISDIGTVITGITPSTQNKLNYSNNDYKFICIPDFKANNRYLKNSNNYISKYAFDKIANKHLHKDDIAISCIGTIGNVGIIWDDCISNQQINSITSINKKFVPMYIYYNLSTKYLLLKKISGNGTALDIIPKSIFEKIEIDIHSIDEQQHIVNTIGTVDDLIEKYQEIAEKIDQILNLNFSIFNESTTSTKNTVMLNTLFWFQEGPGIRNWDYVNDKNGIPFINIKCINDGDILIDKANRINFNLALNKYKHFLLNEDDILLSASGTLGRIAIVRRKHLPLCLNTSVIRFKPLQKNLYSYMYSYLNSNLFKNQMFTKATGSAQQNFGPTILNSMKINIPPNDVLDKYEMKNINFIRFKINVFEKIDVLKNLKIVLLNKYFK